ncbi:hypothetical protein V2G26_006670 [Clonostachys chloroleuca]
MQQQKYVVILLHLRSGRLRLGALPRMNRPDTKSSGLEVTEIPIPPIKAARNIPNLGYILAPGLYVRSYQLENQLHLHRKLVKCMHCSRSAAACRPIKRKLSFPGERMKKKIKKYNVNINKPKQTKQTASSCL